MPRATKPATRPQHRLLAVVGLALLAAGCSQISFPWFSSTPAPVLPTWDSLSPPILVEGVEIEEREAIPIGLPPSAELLSRNLDVLHYDVELVIPEENDRVSSRTTIRYLREGTGPHRLTLDLTGLEVELVTDRGSAVPFEQTTGLLHIDHPGRPGIFDTLQVEVMARGTPADGLILGENVHGMPAAFADNWPNRARFWFPANDHPRDKATVSFTVHAPEGRSVIANGVQVSGPDPAQPERAGGLEGLYTWRWESRAPIPTYLMVIGAAEMEVFDLGTAACGRAPLSPREDGCVEVTGWAYPPDVEHAARNFERAAEMVDLYSELFGPYPFEKLAHVQSSTRFGGMENASAIFYSENAIAQGREIEGTVAHEIVHQWFGNSVTPSDWAHLWLSEGFASYFGPYFWHHVGDEDTFRSRIASARDRYLASDVTNRPVLDWNAGNLLDLLNANSYEKGALVLHMLRWVVGDPAFFAGVRAYYQGHAGGNAETDDLQRALEASHGDALEWFFRQWLRSPGYPEYHTSWEWDEPGQSARVTIVQAQDTAWPTFRMPVEMEFRMDGGVHRVRHWVDGREWAMSIPLPQRPVEMRFDPDGWLLMTEVRLSGD